MDYYEKIIHSIEIGETEEVISYINLAIEKNDKPDNILKKGLIAGIEKVAEKFRESDLLVPEVILSTRALQAGLKSIQPYLSQYEQEKQIKVLIGTVAGDLHDIGKNIIKVVVSSLGIEIVDLGIDVSVEDFLKGIREEKPDILMMSALLTTTVNQMGECIQTLEKEGLRNQLLVFVGGAPVTDAYAKKIGADYCTPDISELKDLLVKIISGIRK